MAKKIENEDCTNGNGTDTKIIGGCGWCKRADN